MSDTSIGVPGLRRHVPLQAGPTGPLADTEPALARPGDAGPGDAVSSSLASAADDDAALGLSVMREAGRRLGRASLMFAAGMVVAVGVWVLSVAVGWRRPEDLVSTIIVGPILLVVSVALYLVARTERLHPRRLLDVGLAFEVAGALGLSLLIFWNAEGPPDGMTRAPWLCVWLVLFPLLVPTDPRRSIVASCLSALTAPLALATWVVAGHDAPSVRELFYLFVPVAFCLGLSVLPTLVVYRLGQQVTRAERELRRLGRWVLTTRIGKGGMGEVWRAHHAVIARPAAVKVIRSSWLVDTALVDRATVLVRFEREARAIAELRSPHTVELYDYGIADDGSLYYAMEFLEGLDLETLVKDHGPLPPARVVHLLRQVCDSLAEAHQAGLVHRDIKPANVIAVGRGLDHDFAKVLDFGLVKVVAGERPADDVTAAGEVVGTGAFMAPEMAAGRPDVDARADIYSVGCLAYWLLTGKPVFDVEGGNSVLYAHMRTPPSPPSERTERAIPPELEAVVMECLAKERAARPATARALAERLTECDLGDDPWTAADAEAWWRAVPERGPVRGSSAEYPTAPYAAE